MRRNEHVTTSHMRHINIYLHTVAASLEPQKRTHSNHPAARKKKYIEPHIISLPRERERCQAARHPLKADPSSYRDRRKRATCKSIIDTRRVPNTPATYWTKYVNVSSGARAMRPWVSPRLFCTPPRLTRTCASKLCEGDTLPPEAASFPSPAAPPSFPAPSVPSPLRHKQARQGIRVRQSEHHGHL